MKTVIKMKTVDDLSKFYSRPNYFAIVHYPMANSNTIDLRGFETLLESQLLNNPILDADPAKLSKQQLHFSFLKQSLEMFQRVENGKVADVDVCFAFPDWSCSTSVDIQKIHKHLKFIQEFLVENSVKKSAIFQVILFGDKGCKVDQKYYEVSPIEIKVIK